MARTNCDPKTAFRERSEMLREIDITGDKQREYLKTRALATEPCFVWIPCGWNGGEPSGMVGYWYGEHNNDGRAMVEFHAGFVPVHAASIYIATDKEIEEDAV